MRIGTMGIIAGLLSAIAAAGVIFLHPTRAAHVAAGLEAHSMCSAIFVQNVDPHAVQREMVQQLTGPAGQLLSFKIDRETSGVDAWFIGSFHARADFTPGYGCRLRLPGDAPPPRPLPLTPAIADAFAPLRIVTTHDPLLASAIDRVFTERPGEKPKHVKAVVIVKDGHVIAERYASGVSIDTTLLSYSVAKVLHQRPLGRARPTGPPRRRPADRRAGMGWPRRSSRGPHN